ncbi:MAG: alpha/beta hydrolase [Methylobacter sp.]
MIYFPATYSLAQLSQQADRSGLKPWPSENNYLGLVEKTGNTPSKGTIVVFHGNAGSALDRIYLSLPLTELGYRVVLAEYPGYGARTGAPSEQALISDGIAAVKQALADFGGPIFLWGESLGGVVGGIIKSGQIPVKGIVLVTPFSNLADVAQHHYWFFPVKWLIRDKFDNIENLKNYRGNTAILLAEQDQIVPDQFGLKLFKALPNRKKLWTFEHAGHNTLPLDRDQAWWQEVMQFISEQSGESP